MCSRGISCPAIKTGGRKEKLPLFVGRGEEKREKEKKGEKNEDAERLSPCKKLKGKGRSNNLHEDEENQGRRRKKNKKK